MKEHFHSKFPLFSKSEVNGPKANRVFLYLRTHSSLYNPNINMAKRIPWNFAKFLLNSEGKVVHFFKPDDSLVKVREEIEKLL